jgi:uncharacterized protein
MNGIDNLLVLNNAHSVETGPLTQKELTAMLDTAFHSAVEDGAVEDGAVEDGGKDGLLIAFDQDGDYASPNFLWFKARYERFVYVDRIIVAEHARGRGLARKFYEGLFNRARGAGHDRVVCEVNLDPPNPGSLRFHAAMGFVSVGDAVLENGKTVRYMERVLA